MNLNQIISNHLLNYNQSELDSLVSGGRTTYEELASSIKKDLDRNYQSELQSLSNGIPIKDYVALIMSTEGLILSSISKA